MKFKKTMIATFAAISLVTFAGCGSKSTENKTEKVPDQFKIIKKEDLSGASTISTIYDKQTFVMYAFTTRPNGGVNLIPLYNADGTLRTYKK